MAMTATTQLGDNTWIVSYAMGASVDDISTAVNAVAISGGWTVHDADAGTNAICYRAGNLDGSTYKYVVLDYNTAGWMFVKTYESWDETTHVGLNVCPNGEDKTKGYQQALNLTTDKGLIYCFVNPRYMAFIIRQYSSAILGNTVTCGISGVFEFSRDNPDDTVVAGYPVHCFLNTGIAGENAVSTNETISIPRTKSGNKGAQQYGEISTVFGKTLYTAPWLLKNILPNTVSLWSGKDWAVSLYAQDGTPTTPSVRGRIQGLKAFSQTRLNFMDRIQVPCDAGLNYDPTGDLVDHFVIPGGKQGSGIYTVRFLIPA